MDRSRLCHVHVSRFRYLTGSVSRFGRRSAHALLTRTGSAHEAEIQEPLALAILLFEGRILARFALPTLGKNVFARLVSPQQYAFSGGSSGAANAVHVPACCSGAAVVAVDSDSACAPAGPIGRALDAHVRAAGDRWEHPARGLTNRRAVDSDPDPVRRLARPVEIGHCRPSSVPGYIRSYSIGHGLA